MKDSHVTGCGAEFSHSPLRFENHQAITFSIGNSALSLEASACCPEAAWSWTPGSAIFPCSLWGKAPAVGARAPRTVAAPLDTEQPSVLALQSAPGGLLGSLPWVCACWLPCLPAGAHWHAQARPGTSGNRGTGAFSRWRLRPCSVPAAERLPPPATIFSQNCLRQTGWRDWEPLADAQPRPRPR